jgi:predicted ATPase/DNA-binding winged helix-turn-helix (wHTH) protein
MALSLVKQERSDLSDARQVTFGPFTLKVPERLLLNGEAPVQIGSRSLDLLTILVRNAGQVVGKRELIDQVWQGLIVEEGALRVHINGLRKALGDGRDGSRYIANVPGRGYSFVGVIDVADDPPPHPPRPSTPIGAKLPPVHGRVVGRDAVVASLTKQISDSRFISLVGPGGIGKTTVAIETARQFGMEFGAEVYFVNLSVVADADLVHASIATMLGAGTGGGSPINWIVDCLRNQRSLFVLDSCEHLMNPVATLLEAVYNEAPLAHILTTTREALGIEGEQIVRLGALDVPPEEVALTAETGLRYSAVQLFVDRVSASVPDFAITDETAPIIGGICRKLDGVALAIELSAGRVEAYGIAGMAELLDRRMGLIWRGRRTAPPRHQTLEATLEWSYDFLGCEEKWVFSRLAIFVGQFTLEAAEAVASDAKVDAKAVFEALASLIAKSLVSSVPGSSPLRYRLLDTTRTYALMKLAQGGSDNDVAKRHAKFFVKRLDASAENRERSAVQFMDELNDVRSALQWCFGERGDTLVGTELTAAAATFLLEHSLCDECHRWTKLALGSLTEAQSGTVLELELQTSLAWSGMFSGNGEAVQAAFQRGHALAQSDPDPHRQLSLLNGLNFILSRKCDFAGALDLAEQAAGVARGTGDASTIALADWALGVCHHLCGHQSLVDDYCMSAIRPPTRSPYVRAISAYGYDYRGRALIARARALWLRGFSSQAAAEARFAIDVVEELSHPVSLFVVLTYAATVFIWCNDWGAAEATIDRLLSHSRTNTLVYRNIGAALKAMLDCRRRSKPEDADVLWRSLDRLLDDRHLILVPMCRTTLAEALLVHGRPEEARRIIDAAVKEFAPDFRTVDGPEILRVKGATSIALGDPEEGERFLVRALKLAQQQSALAWELRAATTLTRARQQAGRGYADIGLESIYARFTEGHDIDDLRDANMVLDGTQFRQFKNLDSS